MGETISLVFRHRENGTYEVQVKENTSGRTVTGNFVPPYTGRQLTALQKRLNTLDSSYEELREIGCRLFQALCDVQGNGKSTSQRETAEPSVRTVLRTTIQRTLKRRGTVALTFSFASGCDEFVRYPWELLHNGDHFLLVSGIFTLTRALVRPEVPVGCELPVRPPFRVLYMGSSPTDCEPLETEQSFSALERGLAPLIETNQVFLDRLEPPSFDQLVRYLNSSGGVGTLDDSDTAIPCYVIHFDGHGAYGRLCPSENCGTVNEADAHKCAVCGASLTHVKAQTYLCFCNEFGCNQFIDTQTLRDLFLTSDIRLAVFSACETATVAQESSRRRQHRAAVDATLATALVTAQVPAVIAMPFALQDELSPTFIYHFYEALADGRTLEEALSRARQALLSRQQMSWFIPVLYRHVAEGQEAPVPLLISGDAPEEYAHPLEHLNPAPTFIGRERELGELDELLAAAMGDHTLNARLHLRLRPGTHHIALTGSPGIGKSALACEVVRRNHQLFPGGIIGVSLEGNKAFGDALLEIMHQIHKTPSLKTPQSVDVQNREHVVVGTFRTLANRELPCLLILDGFEEVKDHAEQETWLRFLCSLPQEVVVIVTSRLNPETMMIDGSAGGAHCRWYEYHIGNMTDGDLLKLFADLAEASGLDQRIHLDDEKQQVVLREICTLLDGYPLGAELIFGAARSIGGKLFAPEAATRSLEEIRDELRSTPLAGILAVLEVAYNRLTPPTRLLLSYLAAFKLPFSHEQIMLLVAPETLATANDTVYLLRDHDQRIEHIEMGAVRPPEEVVPAELAQNWRGARDELVQASFMQFDGRVYIIHPQVRHFALSHLPMAERGRVHRVVAAYYYTLPHPNADEWFAAFEHLENASEAQDLQEAITVAVRAFHSLDGHGHIHEVLAMLRRANGHASRLGNKVGEGQVQFCLGTILRQQGKYPEAEACLRSSLEFHKAQQQHDEVGWALYELALLFREEGDFQQAGTYAQEALDLFRKLGDAMGEARILLVLGEVSRGYASYHEALEYFEQALTRFRTLHSKEGIASTLRDRGIVFEALGRYTKALNDYEEAHRLFTELELREQQAWVLTDKSAIYIDQGKLDSAAKMCSDALAIFREQGIRHGEGFTLREMGDITRKQHDLSRARTYYEEALTLFSALGDRVDQARALNGLGATAFEEGNYLEAREQFEQAQAIAHEQGVRQIDGRALRGLGDVARLMRHFGEAERFYQQALTIAVELGTPAEHSAVLHRRGLLMHAQGKYRETLADWVHALSLDQRLEHPTYQELHHQIDHLMVEQHLEEVYAELCKQYDL